MSGLEKIASLLKEAADTIARLEQENKELKEAQLNNVSNNVEKTAGVENGFVSSFGEIDDMPYGDGPEIDSSKALDLLLNEGKLPDEV